MVEKEVKDLMGGNVCLDIVNYLKQGKSINKIRQQLNISKQLLSYYLRRLKNLNLIKNIGYGTWEVTSKGLPKVAEIRGHAFLWKVKGSLKINWIKLLEENKINYKLIGFGKTPSILFQDKKIWFGKENIIIYEPESFMGINAIETRKFAVSRLIEVLEALEKRLDINLKPYEFKVARHHYSIIKNSLAIQCNKIGQKIEVSNSKGMWFIIDNSYNLNEAETIHPETALIDNLGVQKYFNEHKETKFEVTPKFILNRVNELQKQIEQVTQNQLIMAENNLTHISAVQSLDKGVKKLTKVLKGVLTENRDLKLLNKHQLQLKEFL